MTAKSAIPAGIQIKRVKNTVLVWNSSRHYTSVEKKGGTWRYYSSEEGWKNGKNLPDAVRGIVKAG